VFLRVSLTRRRNFAHGHHFKNLIQILWFLVVGDGPSTVLKCSFKTFKKLKTRRTRDETRTTQTMDEMRRTRHGRWAMGVLLDDGCIRPPWFADDDDDVDDNAASSDEDECSSSGLDAEMRRCCCLSTEQGGGDDDDTSKLSSQKERKANGRQGKNKTPSIKSKQHQHSLEHLQQRVSDLMTIFQEHDWFVPLPNSNSNSNSSSATTSEQKNGGKGKVKSNRNYGADKKRQRKQAQRQLLERRIQQLETCLKQEHGYSE
jgi:hypothetical protein